MRQQVGSYEIVRVIARGGMAVVYLAHQPALDRSVALKQLDLQGAEPTVAQRFVREARLAAGLDHPNVVTLFDFFEDGGVPYIAMEYVRGGSLRPLVGHLSLPQVFGVLEGVLAGLAHAEEHGIAHRDLKPENVLITQGGKVKIADFGIARAYNALTPALTSTDTAIGTPAYMAPEQALNEPLGPFTDIYALGAVAYELLAGRPPFVHGRTPMAILYCHVHKAPPPLADLAPDVPEPVRGWVDWLLAKPPADRPASAAAAWEALEEIAVAELGPYWRRSAAIEAPEADEGEAPTVVDLPVAPTPLAPGRAPPRRRLALALAGAAVAAIAAGAVAVAVLGSGSDTPRNRATTGAQPPPTGPADPYDFDGDGRQELVIGMPGAGPGGAGVVLVRGRRGDAAADTVVTARDAGLGPLHGKEDFGTSLASGDFDGDGHADLAVSAPGRDEVIVVHGTKGGLRPTRVETIHASEMRYLRGGGEYGSRLLAGDLNHDGLADLLVGAPAADQGRTGSGAIQILYGGRSGMKTNQPYTLFRTVEAWQGFGTKLRTGDLNGDGNLDLVEGAADARDGSVTGHGSYCLGRHNGHFRDCVGLEGPVSSGTSALAVADLNGDGRGDIVQGDAVVEPDALTRGAVGGEVRVWMGRRSGPARRPQVLDQRSSLIPGNDELGDGFGTSVDAGDLDGDGYDDIVVCAPYDDEAGATDAGSVIVIRGGRNGLARAADTRFTQTNGGVPGAVTANARLGWSLAVIDVSGDRKLDVVLLVHGATKLEDSVYVLRRGKGPFAPGETTFWRPLRGRIPVTGPRIGRIRFGRLDGGGAA